MINAKRWLAVFFVIVLGALIFLAGRVITVDPFFHFHYPLTDEYFYEIDNPRSMNNGIIKNFQYNALITGTSMAANFRTSELDKLFNVNSIKLIFTGGRYKEINDNVIVALKHNPALKLVIRCIDYNYFFLDPDEQFSDSLPDYLYDNNYLNDSSYIFNRDVLFNRIYTMKKGRFTWTGLTPFDEYANWMDGHSFGIASGKFDGTSSPFSAKETASISPAEKEILLKNIALNITSVAEAYPNVEFYYFFPPYSALWWQVTGSDGLISKYIEAEEIMIEEILKYPNIKLFSFNNRMDITCDLNNYKDDTHYGEWVNSLILKWMSEEKYLITKENYQKYLAEEYKNYSSFDYSSLSNQEDYFNDFFADALVREEYSGVVSAAFQASDISEERNALISEDKDMLLKIECSPILCPQDSICQDSIFYYYSGIKWDFKNDRNYRYLVFDALADRDIQDAGIYIFDKDKKFLDRIFLDTNGYNRQYLFDLSNYSPELIIIFYGGHTDSSERSVSATEFKNIRLY